MFILTCLIDNNKDTPINIIIILSLFLVIFLLFAILYPMCCRRPLIIWKEKFKLRRLREYDDSINEKSEVSQSLII